MITGLALSSIGVNVRILEQLSVDAILRPALDAEGLGPDEPLIFSPKSLDQLKAWGLAAHDERRQQVPSPLSMKQTQPAPFRRAW